MEAELCNDLRDDKEKSDVDAEELAEVPLRQVDEEAVEAEGGDSEDEPLGALGSGGSIEAGLEEGVAKDFEGCGEGEDGKCTEGRGYELVEGVFHGRFLACG